MALKERKSYRRKFERVTIIVRLQEKESFVDNATYVATKSHHSGTQISGSKHEIKGLLRLCRFRFRRCQSGNDISVFLDELRQSALRVTLRAFFLNA